MPYCKSHWVKWYLTNQLFQIEMNPFYVQPTCIYSVFFCFHVKSLFQAERIFRSNTPLEKSHCNDMLVFVLFSVSLQISLFCRTMIYLWCSLYWLCIVPGAKCTLSKSKFVFSLRNYISKERLQVELCSAALQLFQFTLSSMQFWIQ